MRTVEEAEDVVRLNKKLKDIDVAMKTLKLYEQADNNDPLVGPCVIDHIKFRDYGQGNDILRALEMSEKTMRLHLHAWIEQCLTEKYNETKGEMTVILSK